MKDVKKGNPLFAQVLICRLALGATLSVSVPNTQFQNRMNRKLGITTNGSVKSIHKNFNQKDSQDTNNKKREANEESESEEDSKAKLINKKSKKSDAQNSTKEVKINPALQQKTDVNPSTSTHPTTPNGTIIESKPSELKSFSSQVPTINRKSIGIICPPNTPAGSPFTDLPKSSDIRPEAENQNDNAITEETNGTKGKERKRLKKEKKKERKRLKKEMERQRQAEDEKDEN